MDRVGKTWIQQWGELSVKERKLALEQMLGIGDDDAVNRVMNIIDELFFIPLSGGMKSAMQPGHKEVKGFGQKR